VAEVAYRELQVRSSGTSDINVRRTTCLRRPGAGKSHASTRFTEAAIHRSFLGMGPARLCDDCVVMRARLAASNWKRMTVHWSLQPST
jgi:hypothetical protein